MVLISTKALIKIVGVVSSASRRRSNNSIYYQNTNAYNVGVGVYATNKLYISLAYNNSNSIYKGIEDTQTASIYGYYSLTQHWFATLNYAYGISDTASKNYAAIRVGYYF